MEDYSEYDLITKKDPEDNDEIRPPRRFARSVSNTVIAGVCGGLGDWLNVEPNMLRVIFILLSLFGGWGIIVYILLTVTMNIAPDPDEYTL
ncbi:MAG: PspC domain-containing protein, partial [Bacteroidota bacterium]